MRSPTPQSIGNLTLGRVDVLVDVGRQDVERHVAAEDDRVVERLQVVSRSERGLCPLALTVDLAVPDLVAARLARPRAVAIDLARNLLGVRAVDVDEKPHSLLAGPTFRV